MLDRDTIYVGGSWVLPATDARIAVENPATEEIVAHVPEAVAADVDRAVAAARAAFDEWAATDPAERLAVLTRLRDLLYERQGELASLITTEVGAPVRLAQNQQTAGPLRAVDAYLDLLAKPAEPERLGNSVLLRQPVGVVGAITPWNYPLNQSLLKIVPALAAGCTVVHKPSELTPLTAYALAEIIDAAGVPPGVYNMVCGLGPVAGEALAGHPEVDMVSFTGSTRAGRRVAELAARTIKRVALELGGKSANILLPDADHETAVKVGVGYCFLNSGQTCSALTRMLVHESRYDEVVELAAGYAQRYQPGDPTDPATRLGPLISAAQRDRLYGLLRQAVAEGARVVTGGPDATGLPGRGYFVAPTVLADVPVDSVAAQEEFFGPVLSVMRYSDEDEAVRIANATRYGLAGAVWSADVERAMAVARRLRTGQVDVNGAPFNPLAPFGGFKESGYGREYGPHGLAEFQEITSVQLP